MKLMGSAAIFLLIALFLQIVFGDKGLLELRARYEERDRLIEKNKIVEQENALLYQLVCRLRNDPVFIENIARQELGMIRDDEVIFNFRGKGYDKK